MTGDAVPARVSSRADVGGGLTRLVLDVPETVLLTHRTPGQYTRVDEVGYFVLASSPGMGWELVVSEETARELPDAFTVTAALGRGFPHEDAHGMTLAIVVMRGAIAAARTLVRQRLASADGPATDVFIGLHLARDLPLADEIARWQHDGCRVTLCVTDEPVVGDARVGRAQIVARAIWETKPPDWVFAAGSEAMMKETSAIAKAVGVAPSRIFENT